MRALELEMIPVEREEVQWRGWKRSTAVDGILRDHSLELSVFKVSTIPSPPAEVVNFPTLSFRNPRPRIEDSHEFEYRAT